jgi:hypothetical protein
VTAEAAPFRAGGWSGGEDETRGLETLFQQAWRLGSRLGVLPGSRVVRIDITPAQTVGRESRFQNGQQSDSEILDPTGKGLPTGQALCPGSERIVGCRGLSPFIPLSFSPG